MSGEMKSNRALPNASSTMNSIMFFLKVKRNFVYSK